MSSGPKSPTWKKRTPSVNPKKVFPKSEFYVEDVSEGETKWLVLQIKEKLCSVKSEYQKIVVFDTWDYGRVMVIDDSVQTAESDEYIYHEVIISA